MAATLKELTTPLTPDECKASIYRILAVLGVSVTSWKPGAVARTIIAATSVLLAAFSTLSAQIAKSGFLELAEGDWLTLVARYVYGVERIEATFATGVVTLTNSGGGIYIFDPGDLVVIRPSSGGSEPKTYRNTTAFTLAAGATVSIPVQATEQGASSTASPGLIAALETTLLGVTVTNALAVIGLDAEQDVPLRLRSLEKLSSLSPNGPRGAYEYFAKTAKRANGETIGVTRVKVSTSSPVSTVTVTVATATGTITGTTSNPATDLGAIQKALIANAVPLTATLILQSATPVTISVTYEVWIYDSASLTSSELQALIAARLTSFMSTQPIGGNVIAPATGKVFVDAIRTAIGATRPEIFHVEVTVPAADVTIGATSVPVLGTIGCIAVHQVTA